MSYQCGCYKSINYYYRSTRAMCMCRSVLVVGYCVCAGLGYGVNYRRFNQHYV